MIENTATAAAYSTACPSLIKITDVYEPIQYQLQILNRHELRGIIPCHLSQQAGQKQIWHDISGLVPLPEYLRGRGVDPTNGDCLIYEICEIICRSARYLLPPSQLILDAEQIYLRRTAGFVQPTAKITAGAVHLLFNPVQTGEKTIFNESITRIDAEKTAAEEKRSVEAALSRLIKTICGLFNIDYPRQEQLLHILHEQGISGLTTSTSLDPVNREVNKPVEAAEINPAPGPPDNYSAGPHQAVNKGRPVWPSMKSGLAILPHVLLIGSAAAILSRLFDPGPVLRAFILTAALLILVRHVLKLCSTSLKLKGSWLNEQAKNRLIQFKDQIRVLNRPRDQYDDANTADRLQQTLIIPTDPASFRIATLTENPPDTITEKDGLRAYILVEQFIIGRDQNKTDLCLPESAIGRQHARISRKGGSFFICDLGSKNGTRLDDQLLEKYQDTLLPESCRLLFADHQFYFKAQD